jgi:hypothetical protein
MKHPAKTAIAIALAVLVNAGAAQAGKHEYGADGDMMALKGSMIDNGFRDIARTASRLPSGDIFAPQKMYDKPEHFAFKPYV